ncbi:MAG: CDP-glycerol glycerophosphotransferase family protein [Clostridium sp.]|uniref:CDP-glycerol glycerophosphotransferase family protein n=2 Tax=Clostridium TaxID=1485 RepID=UPI001DAE031E|nr:CDP-glycerol glycerophosphotransferase family protein [Clostridium sp.]MBS5124828.1 CDP-glycerol glycerophosphotransferase family protein [Clostridium sp.]
MRENIVYINDINFKNGIINIDSKIPLSMVAFESKDKYIIKDNIENSNINITKLLEKNYRYIKSGLYKLKIMDNENFKDVIINSVNVSGKEYICKNYCYQYLNNTYIFDIYINNKNEIKIKIKLDNKNVDGINIIENIEVYYKDIFLGIKCIREEEINDIKRTIYPQKAKVILYGYETGEKFIYEFIESNNGIFKFKLSLDDFNKVISNKFEMILCVDDNVEVYTCDNKVTLKKIMISDEEIVKFANIVISEKNILNIMFTSELVIKPVIESILYDNKIIFKGKLNYNYNFFVSKNYNIKVNFIQEKNKNQFEKEVLIDGNNFEFILESEDIYNIKNMAPEKWQIFFNVYNKQKSIQYELNYIKLKATNILSKELFIKDEKILFKANVSKSNKKLELSIKNNVTISKILYILYSNKKIEIKYRTKENIEKLLDNNNLNTEIYNDKGRFKSKKIKKIGLKTFIAYYSGEDIYNFIKEASKKGINILINDKNNFMGNSYIKELDSDNIYMNKLQKLQKTKKYKKICNKLYNKVFIKLPINKKRVMFESFLGRNVSGNPKYLYEQMIKDGLDNKYDLIWILNNIDEPINGSGKKVKRKTLKYYYYMATSKYWIFNCRQADEIIKRKENIYLQTWHGTPLKKLAMDMDNVNMAGQTDINEYKEKFYNNSRRWDYLLIQNDYSREIFKKAFAFNKTILNGYPANDILYTENNKESIDKIKDKLNIPKNKKIILYAPTWRDDNFYKKGHYRMNIELDLDKMQKELGNEYIILLRMHYLITNNINIEKYKGFVYDYSQGYDIQELYLVSDILITDYSSVMFDYSNLNRPIIFFTYDIEQYRDALRGFYFDFEEEAPGPLVVDTEGVIECLKSIDDINKQYKNKKEKFYNKFCHIDDGNKAKEILDAINLK